MLFLNISMGTITISIEDETESRFRETVKQVAGEGKGKLGKAVEEALASYVAQRNQEIIAKKAEQALKGFALGKLKIKDRDELYER